MLFVTVFLPYQKSFASAFPYLDPISIPIWKRLIKLSELTIENGNKLPCHEWFIEFEELEINLKEFEQCLDDRVQEKNIYYKDLIKGKILKTLEVKKLSKGKMLN